MRTVVALSGAASGMRHHLSSEAANGRIGEVPTKRRWMFVHLALIRTNMAGVGAYALNVISTEDFGASTVIRALRSA